jgi:hypothetical protein
VTFLRFSSGKKVYQPNTRVKVPLPNRVGKNVHPPLIARKKSTLMRIVIEIHFNRNIRLIKSTTSAYIIITARKSPYFSLLRMHNHTKGLINACKVHLLFRNSNIGKKSAPPINRSEGPPRSRSIPPKKMSGKMSTLLSLPPFTLEKKSFRSYLISMYR